MDRTVIRSALRTTIFEYISACPSLQCTADGVFRQFNCIGYSRKEINQALTQLQQDGCLVLDDSGILSIGDATKAA